MRIYTMPSIYYIYPTSRLALLLRKNLSSSQPHRGWTTSRPACSLRSASLRKGSTLPSPASGNNGYGATNNNSSNTGGGVFSPGKPPTMEVISEGGGNRDSVSNDSFSDDESDSSGGANKRQRASSK